MWSPFSAKPLFSQKEWDATEELYRIERVLGKTSLLPSHLRSSLSYSIPHIAHLSGIAFFSLCFLDFQEFVNSANDWFWDRGALREGKSVVISKLSGILCLLYESCMHHFLDSWCEYADIVVSYTMPPVIQYTTRVHSHLCLRQQILYYWIHKQTQPEYLIKRLKTCRKIQQ